MIVSHDSGEPNTYNEAIGSFAKELWMEEKMESMNVNHVQDLDDFLPNHRAIENKWFYI